MLAALLAIAVSGIALAALLIWLSDRGSGPLAREECVATADGTSVSVSITQAENATTIASVAAQRELPARALTIALATAYQESDLYNVDYGDRDSLGLFQQRPSQGWGTPEQVQDPVYAANAFFDALTSQVPDYRELEVTVAAQAVQRSAFPDAYANHETKARILASALTGYSQAAFTCTYTSGFDSFSPEAEGQDGLTPRARTAHDELTDAFGELDIGGFQPGGVSSGHIDGSAHYDGRALDVMFEPYDDARQTRRGWATAHWAVANAQRLGLATVIFDEMIWTARRSGEGWRPYTHPSGDTDNITLRHLDHVHIDVVAG